MSRKSERIMNKFSVKFELLACALLSACSYKVEAPIAPSYDVYSSYSDKVPGRWAILVNGNPLKGDFKVSGYNCSAHTYPLDAEQAFDTSAVRTLENIVESAEEVKMPLSRDQLLQDGYAGLIRLNGEDLDVDLDVVPGFWSVQMEARVQLTAALAVDGSSGRLLGGRIASEADSKAEAGGGCGGGADAISKATQKALKRLMEELGEKVSNEARLRQVNSPIILYNPSQRQSNFDPYAIDPTN